MWYDGAQPWSDEDLGEVTGVTANAWHTVRTWSLPPDGGARGSILVCMRGDWGDGQRDAVSVVVVAAGRDGQSDVEADSTTTTATTGAGRVRARMEPSGADIHLQVWLGRPVTNDTLKIKLRFTLL